MKQYYLVRRIMPENSQWHPTFQLVFCDSDRQKVENYLEEFILKNEQLASLAFASYSIEMHSDNISGRELERRWLARDRQEKQMAKHLAALAEADQRTWADYDEEMMSEGSQPNL